MPILILGIVGMAAGYFIKDFSLILNFVKENQIMIIASLFILVIIFLIVSINLSINFYKRRDF